MPRFDLRTNDNELDRLAVFKVLAVMCQPRDRNQRERMLATIQMGTGAGHPRRSPLSGDEFMAEVRLTAARASVAGSLLLTQLQLQGIGRSCSLNTAFPLVATLLPRWEQPASPQWSKNSHVTHRPGSRRKMLAAYVQFRPVLHLWAAMIHGREHGRDDISLDSPKNLPAFIGIAESILKMARTLPSGGADRRFAVKPSEAWSFTLPERFHQSADLVALLLNEEQLRVLNEHKARNRLS